jgi:cytochrome c
MKFNLLGIVAASTLAVTAFGALPAAADGDAAAGEKIFTTKCKVCHQIGPGAKNFVGPDLNGVAGRKAGSEEGYNYSDAMKNSGLTWDEATFKEYIKDPKAKVPGVKMIFAGLPKDTDQDNLYAYLSQFKADGSK